MEGKAILAVRGYKERLVEYVSEFIRIPSRSSAHGGEEGELQSLIAAYMRKVGARVRTFEAGDIPECRNHALFHGPSREYAKRPTVIGELGPEDGPALLVLAYSDTVQVFKPELWTVDPFCGEVRNGSIYGLGASDDKWGLAAMLVMMQVVQDSAKPLEKKLIFASTIDEENGVGNGTLLLALAGIRAEAALYLDGYRMQISVGCLGGSNLYLRPKQAIPERSLSEHVRRLTTACQILSHRRAPLFERPMFSHNVMKNCSVQVVLRKDDAGHFILVPFYSLPGEDAAVFCRELEAVIENTLGEETAAYNQSYRYPWFEPALLPDDTPLIRHVAASVRDVLRFEPHITTISKQDSFVLTNHTRIPTVSFGCTGRTTGRGAFHNPDEYIEIVELWDGLCVAHSAVCNWLEC